MAGIEDIKTIGSVLMKAGNIELYKQLLDYQAEAQTLNEENMKLKNEVGELKEKLLVKEQLVFENNQYFRVVETQKLGPYCSRCWDAENILMHLHIHSDGYSDCPKCKTGVHKSNMSYNESYNSINDIFGY